MSNKKKSETGQVKEGFMARAGFVLADWSEKWFPDAYIFAIIAVVIVGLAALFMGRTPIQIGVDFGSHFWDLVPFAMQMAFVVISGYVVATSKPVNRLIVKLSTIPKTPKTAVAFVAFFAMVASLLSWGFSLIFSGILIREVSKRVKGVDYRAIGAAGYLGLGSIWALGLSSAPALLMTTKSSIPTSLYKISGTIPLTETIFTWQNLVMIIVLIVMSVTICYYSTPNADKAKTAEMAGINYGEVEETKERTKAEKPGEWLEYSPILTLVIVSIGIVYVFNVINTKGPIAALDLNTYNFIFLMLGMLLHWTPRSFLNAAAKAIPATGGVLIQFPIYAGIFGVLMGSGLTELLMKFFLSISTQNTFPAIVGIYSAILGLFLPSGGGKFVVEAPYLLEAAKHLHVGLGWVVQVYNAAEALPNFINPFWMLPLMGIMGVKARDLAGFSILQLVFHLPVVIFMVWILAKTVPYIPAIF
ncbi:short-chain fatty acid transporter [Clostridium estertheticum]|uniref:short-chain fatty acid transporter n=1 Tax=Clostridium estertheticum TaxID=238834 RepID=UPI001C0D995F|nr:TIGR00366 family protein [Clostridium estertheticum]MBU3071999.1 TIGR00366 family protein [Clostridium estertheticum]MBU3162091.1 TIGR00366 family protein [Clostridium estertheticum]